MRIGTLSLAQTLAQPGASPLWAKAFAQMQMPAAPVPAPATKADYTLKIAPVTVELAPDHILSTIGYNDMSPGPVLRMREGKAVTVDVINDTDVPELVHWHGMLIPAEVDGVDEEGTPVVPPRSRRRYALTPRPSGSRWYHSHAMAFDDLHRGSYTGQFGFVYVDSGNDPGHYDPGAVPRAARLGALLHQQHGGRRRLTTDAPGRRPRSQTF